MRWAIGLAAACLVALAGSTADAADFLVTTTATPSVYNPGDDPVFGFVANFAPVTLGVGDELDVEVLFTSPVEQGASSMGVGIQIIGLPDPSLRFETGRVGFFEDPVPEPPIWAIMFAAVALTGAALRQAAQRASKLSLAG